ncbi:hypothetical protein BaRGS_00025856, partial [Batillaria attramentaria]
MELGTPNVQTPNGNVQDGPLHKVVEFDRKYCKPEDDVTLRSLVTSWIRKQRKKCTCRRVLLTNFPIIDSLRTYRPLKDLPGDVISGLTVGVMHIPQGMAFAALATLPPIVGLYVSFISSLVYFFIGGCRQASFGVIAITCLMMGSVLDRELGNGQTSGHSSDVNSSALANNVTNQNVTSEADFEAQKLQLAGAVSFIGGLFMIGLGKLGCGFVTTYMPEPLIRGFTTGAATHVAISQMSSLLGISIPRHSGPLKALYTIVDLCKHVPDTNWMTLVISLVSMVIMYVIKIHVNQRFNKKLKIPIPIELIVMIICIVISKFCDLPEDYDLKIVGDIPTGIPAPKFPDLNKAKSSVTDGLVIAIVAFTQSVALAKTFALKHGYKVDSDQEMFAYGVCTVASSLFSGINAAASMARSIVQDGTGGVSQIASLIGCAIVLMVILFLGPLFYYLPYVSHKILCGGVGMLRVGGGIFLGPLSICILSSVIVVNLRGMFRQFLLLKPYWRQSKTDFVVFLATYLAVFIIDVDIGLGVGVAVAVFSVVVRTQRVHITELGDVDNLDIYKPVTLYNKSQVNEVSNETPWTTDNPCNLRHVILDMSGTTFLDMTGAKTLQQSTFLSISLSLNFMIRNVGTSVSDNCRLVPFLLSVAQLTGVIQDFNTVDIQIFVVGLP